MELSKFKELIREKRKSAMIPPYELTLLSFRSKNLDKRDKEYFMSNASEIVEVLRNENWNRFLEYEGKFSSEMYETLVCEENIEKMSNFDAIMWFIKEYPEHIYTLNLSNTQSRRSRAGKEFESIIELILMGANIPFDTQSSVGSGVFATEKLAKLVDCVSPGAIEYKLDKRNTVLISAKTTLRERWQEVGDEMARTMAREMFLATLDCSISEDTISLINQNNIVLVTTEAIKENYYSNNNHVLTFEEMLLELELKMQVWNDYSYTDEDYKIKVSILLGQYEKSGTEFEKHYYKNQLLGLRYDIENQLNWD